MQLCFAAAAAYACMLFLRRRWNNCMVLKVTLTLCRQTRVRWLEQSRYTNKKQRPANDECARNWNTRQDKSASEIENEWNSFKNQDDDDITGRLIDEIEMTDRQPADSLSTSTRPQPTDCRTTGLFYDYTVGSQMHGARFHAETLCSFPDRKSVV